MNNIEKIKQWNDWRYDYLVNKVNSDGIQSLSEKDKEKFELLSDIRNTESIWNDIINNTHVVLDELTIENIEKIFSGKNEIPRLFSTDGDYITLCKGDLHDLRKSFQIKLGKYILRSEESYGGEGAGDEFWTVFSMEDENNVKRYFRWDGWYSSYEGGQLDDLSEVVPTKVEVTQWKAK